MIIKLVNGLEACLHHLSNQAENSHVLRTASTFKLVRCNEDPVLARVAAFSAAPAQGSPLALVHLTKISRTILHGTICAHWPPCCGDHPCTHFPSLWGQLTSTSHCFPNHCLTRPEVFSQEKWEVKRRFCSQIAKSSALHSPATCSGTFC